jgi:hypothetical protein
MGDNVPGGGETIPLTKLPTRLVRRRKAHRPHGKVCPPPQRAGYDITTAQLKSNLLGALVVVRCNPLGIAAEPHHRPLQTSPVASQLLPSGFSKHPAHHRSTAAPPSFTAKSPARDSLGSVAMPLDGDGILAYTADSAAHEFCSRNSTR